MGSLSATHGDDGRSTSEDRQSKRDRNGTFPDIASKQQAEPEHLPTRRIHIMGMGSVGTLLAHSLMCLPNPPPISLLFHRPEMYDGFRASSRILRLINYRSHTNDERSGYDVDVAKYDEQEQSIFWKHVSHVNWDQEATTPPVEEEMMESGEVKIYTMIVTVKGPATVTAMQSIKHRVSAETTICLMQNGMGQVDELNREVFTDPDTRPAYMLGVVSHGIYLSRQFAAIHSGIGSVAVGMVRDSDKHPLLRPESQTPDTAAARAAASDSSHQNVPDEDLWSNITSRYLLRTLTRSPTLVCAMFPYLDLFQLQLEELAIDCIINPVTALLNIPNGSILGNGALLRVSRFLLAEISIVIRRLPELQGLPDVQSRFSSERLETLYLAITKQTVDNSSSMREDIRNHKNTEVDYINGYIIRRGEEMGIKCVLNYMLTQLVKGLSWESTRTDSLTMPYDVSEVLPTEASTVPPESSSSSSSSSRSRSSDDPSTDTDRYGQQGPVTLEDRGTPRRGEGGRLEKV